MANRPLAIIWLPDMSNPTGWMAHVVTAPPEPQKRSRGKPKRRIGFNPKQKPKK